MAAVVVSRRPHHHIMATTYNVTGCAEQYPPLTSHDRIEYARQHPPAPSQDWYTGGCCRSISSDRATTSLLAMLSSQQEERSALPLVIVTH